MSLGKLEALRSTAAWRISIWTTVAFAIASAVAFALVYFLVARGIHERSDAWLTGEAEVLAEASANTPRDSQYDLHMEKIAMHASHEVPGADRRKCGAQQNSVFFLLTRPGQGPVWVGSDNRDGYTRILEKTRLSSVPATVRFSGYQIPFRVVYHSTADGGALYLGFADLAAARFLRQLTHQFLLVWLGMAALGFCISSFGAYRTLSRVERITDTAARIGSADLASRLPEGCYDDEISRLSRTFNRMLDRIQASVHQLRGLTDSLAHDLKSPITSIRCRLEEALLKDNESWREPVADAIEKLDRLSQMLNTTLDLSEAEAGALQLRREPMDLAAVVQQLADLYEPAFAERKHTLICKLECSALIEVDRSLVNRTLSNLLDNEVAHLPLQRSIWLSISVRGNDAELAIEDDGPGFPPEVKARAFERFVKGGASTGHGLGLAFVDAVVRAHGGRIFISDRDGGGSKIVLLLPLATAQSAYSDISQCHVHGTIATFGERWRG